MRSYVLPDRARVHHSAFSLNGACMCLFFSPPLLVQTSNHMLCFESRVLLPYLRHLRSGRTSAHLKRAKSAESSLLVPSLWFAVVAFVRVPRAVTQGPPDDDHSRRQLSQVGHKQSVLDRLRGPARTQERTPERVREDFGLVRCGARPGSPPFPCVCPSPWMPLSGASMSAWDGRMDLGAAF